MNEMMDREKLTGSLGIKKIRRGRGEEEMMKRGKRKGRQRRVRVDENQ